MIKNLRSNAIYITLVVAILLCGINLNAQNLFETNYSFPGIFSAGFSAGTVQASNGNYVFAGFSGFESTITEIDSIGDLVWSKSFPFTVTFLNLENISTGGFLASGSYGNDAMLMSISNTGTFNWETKITFPNASSVSGDRAIETSTGDFLIAGSVENYDRDGAGPLPIADTNNVFIAKINSAGDVIWKKVVFIDVNAPHQVQDVAEVADGYIFVGYTSEIFPPDTTTDALILKTDFDGNVQWINKFGGDGSNQLLRTASILSNGEVLCSGEDDGDAWLVRVNSAGTITWGKNYVDNGSFLSGTISSSWDAFETSDGKYVTSGFYAQIDVLNSSNFGSFF